MTIISWFPIVFIYYNKLESKLDVIKQQNEIEILPVDWS